MKTLPHVEQRAYLSDSLPAGEWQRLASQMQADSAGYVEVTLQDESPEVAYFDDLLLRIAKEKGIQENHYDPLGPKPDRHRAVAAFHQPKTPRPTSQARPVERGALLYFRLPTPPAG